jgi:hypothetical protein
MSNPLSTVSAPSGLEATFVDLPSSIAGMKRKASTDETAEQNDEAFDHLRSSQAKSAKRAKLAHGDTNVPAPAAKQFTKAKSQDVARASGQGLNVDMADMLEDQPAPPPKTVKPRKSKTASSKNVNSTNFAAVQQPKKRQLAKKTPGSRSKNSATLAAVQQDDDQDMEDAGDDTISIAAKNAKESRPAKKTPLRHSKKSETLPITQHNDDEEMNKDGHVTLNVVTAPISLALLPTGVSTTGKFANSHKDTKFILAGATNDDVEPCVTTAQYAAPIDVEDEKGRVPRYLPAPNFSGVDITSFFKLPLPAKVEPWVPECPQAYSRFETDVDRLIKWDVIQLSGRQGRFGSLAPVDQRAYDLRAPWNVKPLGWAEVTAAYNKEANATWSIECVRQRFENANQIIFAATGVYFGSLGLLNYYGIPLDIDWRNANAGKTSKAKSKKTEYANAELKTTWRKALGFKIDGAVELLIQPPSGGAIIRLVSAKVAKSLRIDASNIIRCTEDTFDRWYSCVCFGIGHNFPKRVYQLKKFAKFEKTKGEFQQSKSDSPQADAKANKIADNVEKVDRKVGKTDGKAKKVDRKLEYAGDEYKYTDAGTPPVTIQSLLDTYCLSQSMSTTHVSDMILEEIRQVLENEKTIATKYTHGCICDNDCNSVVRFQDALPQDIEKLWMATKVDDPIRRLVLGLLTGSTAEEHQRFLVACPRQSALIARNLWSKFIKGQCQDLIAAFVAATSSDEFCAAYHNHGTESRCYRMTDPSALSKQLNDDTLDEPIIHKLEIKGVQGCEVIDNTGSGLNLNLLQGQKPQWDWERIQSINSWIVAHPNRPQTREPRPVYFEYEKTDDYGRYPSHPGYNDPQWEATLDDNEYPMGEWDKAKRFDIPNDAQRVRDGKGTNHVLFDLEDDEWIPPPTFAPEVVRPSDMSYHEFQGYRRWLWVQEGNKIPLETCYRFRPFNVDLAPREDTFKDAPRRCENVSGGVKWLNHERRYVSCMMHFFSTSRSRVFTRAYTASNLRFVI